MKRLTTFLLLGILLFSPLRPAWAAEMNSDEMNVLVEQSTLVIQLKQKLAQMQYRYTLFEANLGNAEKNLEEATTTIENLTLIIANLDEQIQDAERQTLNVKSQKESKKMEIEEIQVKIQNLEAELAEQKEIVSSLMTLLYVKRGTYYSDGSVNAVKVLASPNSVSQTLQEMTYLDLMEQENQDHMDAVSQLSKEVAQSWNEIRIKQKELSHLDEDLAQELEELNLEKAHQQEVLEETKSEKSILEAILSSSDERKEDLESEIRIYQTNVASLEEKLAQANTLLSEDQKATLAQIQSDMQSDFSVEDSSQALNLDWPVSPAKGLSAFFHDSGYQGTFGVDHYALDIRANQGTEIHAPADGVVQNIVFDPNSTRYAYITIAHRMGVTTLYGHISSPAVSIGDYVFRDQVIGYTGAMPGTPGSGARTTGPHLHFEVWQDGIRVDPLKYLPLEEISMDTIPEEYLDQIQAALEDQMKELKEQLE